MTQIFRIGQLAFYLIDGEPYLMADCQEYINDRWGRLVNRMARKK